MDSTMWTYREIYPELSASFTAKQTLEQYERYANPANAVVREWHQLWYNDPILQPSAPEAAEGGHHQPIGAV